MKRSYVRDLVGVRLACDGIIGLMTAEVESKIVGGSKSAVVAVTPVGHRVLAECYPHEADEALERWTRLVFGGSERKVDNGGLVQ